MRTIDRTDRHRFLKVAGIIIIILLALTPIAVISYRLNDAGRSLTATPAGERVNIVKTENGIVLSLDSVKATELETQLTFTMSLPAIAVASSEPEVVGPLFPGDQLQLHGFSPRPSGLVMQMKPHQAGETTLEFTLFVGSVLDPSEGASVIFLELPFAAGSGAHQVIQGPWEFALAPGLVAGNGPAMVSEVQRSSTSDGVAINVDRVTRSADGLFVHYSVTSTRSGPIEPAGTGAKLVFGDGSEATALHIESTEQAGVVVTPGMEVSFIAAFPPVQEAGIDARVEFGPFVSSNDAPASITIRNPFGDWSADPLTIGDDRLEVKQVMYNAETDEWTAVVENTASISTSSIMFGGLGAKATVTDSAGRSYQAVSGSTGMRKQPDGSLGAGGTGFSFVGIDRSASDLTLTVEYSGVLLRGPWSVDLRSQ